MKTHHSEKLAAARLADPRSMEHPSENPPEPLGPELTSILAQSHDGFLRYLQCRLHNRDEAEDVLQDFYLRVVTKARQIRGTESVLPWLRSVLKSTLVDYFRRRSAERKAQQEIVMDLLTTTETQELTPPATQEQLFDRTACNCFYKLLPALKTEYAEVLRRVDLAGDSRHETAFALSITAGNVRVRLHRARKALKRSLQLSCHECQSRGCFCSRRGDDW